MAGTSSASPSYPAFERRAAADAASGLIAPSEEHRIRRFRGRGRKENEMAKKCEICGKATVTGRSVSHAHNVSSRTFEPNLRTVKALIDGASRRIRVCTRCLRSGKVTRPPARSRFLKEQEAKG